MKTLNLFRHSFGAEVVERNCDSMQGFALPTMKVKVEPSSIPELFNGIR